MNGFIPSPPLDFRCHLYSSLSRGDMLIPCRLAAVQICCRVSFSFVCVNGSVMSVRSIVGCIVSVRVGSLVAMRYVRCFFNSSWCAVSCLAIACVGVICSRLVVGFVVVYRPAL